MCYYFSSTQKQQHYRICPYYTKNMMALEVLQMCVWLCGCHKHIREQGTLQLRRKSASLQRLVHSAGV